MDFPDFDEDELIQDYAEDFPEPDDYEEQFDEPEEEMLQDTQVEPDPTVNKQDRPPPSTTVMDTGWDDEDEEIDTSSRISASQVRQAFAQRNGQQPSLNTFKFKR